jgi:hypothetical protein
VLPRAYSFVTLVSEPVRSVTTFQVAFDCLRVRKVGPLRHAARSWYIGTSTLSLAFVVLVGSLRCAHQQRLASLSSFPTSKPFQARYFYFLRR